MIMRAHGNGGSWADLALKMLLDDDGTLYLYESTDGSPANTTSAGSAKLFVDNNVLYAQDNSGSATQLTSHFDPASLRAPQTAQAFKSQAVSETLPFPEDGFAQEVETGEITAVEASKTSFAQDADITLPWSFHHQNPVLGKGTVTDMAKMVAWVEEQMQADLGVDDGKLVYEYDLPESRTVSAEDWIASQVDSAILLLLQNAQWIEVPTDPQGNLPAECFEVVPVIETVEVTREVIEKVLDPANHRIVEITRTITETQEQATSQTESRLKPNYIFSDGKVLRRPTVEDIDEAAIQITPLPEWVQGRVPAEQSSSLGPEQLKAIKKTRLAQLAKAEKEGKLPGRQDLAKGE
jgi:hypothetical protein